MADKYFGDMATLTADEWNDNAVDQAVCTVTSGTRPTGVEGRLIYETDTKRTLRYDGASWLVVWQPWTAFTPSWSNLSVSDGTQEAGYAIMAGVVYCRGAITFGSTTSITGTPTLTPPVATDATRCPTYTPVGVTYYRDDSASANRYGRPITASTGTAVQMRYMDTSGTYTAATTVSSSAPFSWATGDVLYWSLTYPTTI